MDADFKDEIKLLYGISVNDIAFAKNQQWKITNYVIAVYVALFGVWKSVVVDPNVKHLFGIECSFFLLISLITLIAGIYLICIDQGLLERSRGRIDRIVKNFSEEFQGLFQHIDTKKRSNNAYAVLVTQISIMILGYILLAYAIIQLS